MSPTESGIPCDGWWEEHGWGRQLMHELRLRFDSGKISGSGHDIIGLFTFTGTITDQGQVIMLKRYIGQHSVEYVGTYDGEGSMWGEWHIGPLRDRWLIHLSGLKSAESQNAIEEIT